VIIEIVEVENTKYFTTPLDPDVYDLFDILEEAGFSPQIACLNGYDNAIRLQ
jgi:hypothetical protein